MASNNKYFILLCQKLSRRLKQMKMFCLPPFTVLNSYLIHPLLFPCLFPVGRIPSYLSILWRMWSTERDVVFGIRLLSICAGIRCGEPRMKSLMGRIITWGRAGISRPEDVLIILLSVSGISDNALLRLRHGISFLIKKSQHGTLQSLIIFL